MKVLKKIKTANRFEVIDWTENGQGREFVKWEDDNFEIKYDIQDGGRTVKIFLMPIK